MSNPLKNSIINKLGKNKREQYQAIVQKEIDTNFSDAEQRALMVKCIVLLAEEYLPEDVKNELYALHLSHKRYNQPEYEEVA